MSETENKEDFCPVCVAVPIAMASGAGIAGIGSKKDPKKNKSSKLIMLIVGILVSVLSLLIGLYFWRKCPDCK
jgi:disulfide bond formation protein DsbB